MVPESNIEIQNQSGSKTNLDRSNLSDLKNTTDTMQVKMSQDPWILGLQFAISGSAAGLALFFGSLGLDRYRRPILKLAEEYTRDPVSIDLDIYKSINPQYDLELRRFQVKYWVNRIPIRNKGRYAAKNCKVVIKIDGWEEKICWSVPRERYRMTINSKSIEYIDSCAVIDGNPDEIPP